MAKVPLHDFVRDQFEERDRRYEQRFEAQEKAVAAALAASAMATEKAERQNEAWRANANEWRAAMVDREARFATITTVNGFGERLGQMIGDVTRRIDRAEGKSTGLDVGWKILLGVIGVVVSIYAAFHH